MSESITFTVPGPPHGKGRPRASLRGAHIRMYTDARTVAYEDRVCLYAGQAHTGPPWTGPVSVAITTYRKRPARPGPRHECRAGLEGPGGYRYCTTKPDADNCAKSVLDGCSMAGVWVDDVQVVELGVVQVWCLEGETARTLVTVSRLGP